MAAIRTGLTPESIARLIALGEHRRYRRGTVLINEGDQGDALFVIVSGRVKVYSVDDRDREITYGFCGPGDAIGEMSLDGSPRSASVITVEPTVCAMITHQQLLAHIEAYPTFAFELLTTIIQRARMATRSARNLALLDVYGRLVNLLESLATPRDDGTRIIAERLTHAELANRVGCSREMISRLVKDLRSGHYLMEEGASWILPRQSLPARW
jgi:CRP/FNR family cyclic AMP-dependent transcriptional regulator